MSGRLDSGNNRRFSIAQLAPLDHAVVHRTEHGHVQREVWAVQGVHNLFVANARHCSHRFDLVSIEQCESITQQRTSSRPLDAGPWYTLRAKKKMSSALRGANVALEEMIQISSAPSLERVCDSSYVSMCN
jgi:hypothetical protein